MNYHDFADNSIKSFNAKDEGFSLKKMIAVLFSLLVMVVHLKWLWSSPNFSDLSTILLCDYGFITALLGIGTYQSVQTAKAANPVKTTESTTVISKDQPTITKSTTTKEPIEQ